MKKSVTIVILVTIAVVFTISLYYLWQKNQEDPVVYTTEQAAKGTIVKKTVATGSIVPKEEVLIKPNISGIIDEIFVEAGDVIAIPYSDVGWTPLFARAGAVVAAAGGMLSHSSIVAREYRIPCVVSVEGAMQLVDGATVTVDGYAGTVVLETG